jgi:hypothetical protein
LELSPLTLGSPEGGVTGGRQLNPYFGHFVFTWAIPNLDVTPVTHFFTDLRPRAGTYGFPHRAGVEPAPVFPVFLFFFFSLPAFSKKKKKKKSGKKVSAK